MLTNNLAVTEAVLPPNLAAENSLLVINPNILNKKFSQYIAKFLKQAFKKLKVEGTKSKCEKYLLINEEIKTTNNLLNKLYGIYTLSDTSDSLNDNHQMLKVKMPLNIIQKTTVVEMSMNLYASDNIPTATNNQQLPPKPSIHQYNRAHRITIYDNIGQTHLLTIYFCKTGPNA